MVSKTFVAAAALAGVAHALPQGTPAKTNSDPLAGLLGSLGGASGIQNLLGGLGGKAGGVIGDFAQLLAQGDVKYGPAPKGCSDYEILVARGTGEPGPFGAVVGDAIVASVAKDIPGTRGYAVQYPASIDITKSQYVGADDVINRLNNQNKECPKQKFALVGYSQGAAVMHLALDPAVHKPYPGGPSLRPVLDQSVLPKIVAVALFGDPGLKNGQGNDFVSAPDFTQEIISKLRENCNPGDPVCDPNGEGFEKHVMYLNNPWQNETVAFIEAGFKGETLPAAPKNYKDAGLQAAKNGGKGIVGGMISGIASGLLTPKPAASPVAKPAA